MENQESPREFAKRKEVLSVSDSGYLSIGSYLKNRFGRRIVKLSIDGGFTCPNRDGTKGLGGCVFCSQEGSGELASTLDHLDDQILALSKKWPDSQYLAYFQSHTNTYGPVDILRGKYLKALQYPEVIGLAIGTRPDCLPVETIELLSELNEKTFLWVELGLQTIHKGTAESMNLGYSLDDFNQAMDKLRKSNIKTVVHLILGLPGESREMMEASLDYVCKENPFGIKLHMLNIIKGSPMETQYPNYQPFPSLEEYVELITHLLKRVPPNITVHRLTGDVPRDLLIAPSWSYKKMTILNEINNKMPGDKTL